MCLTNFNHKAENTVFFLGKFVDDYFVNFIDFDLYFSPSDNCLLARYSNNEEDVMCISVKDFLDFQEAFKATNSAIYEAYKRAKACNFI